MSILPGVTVDAPFYRYRATGDEVCEKCLYLDLRCFPAKEAVEIESELVCSCPHVWDAYICSNNAAITEHAKMGWMVGLSASGVPCLPLCPPDLLRLIKRERETGAELKAEQEKIDLLFYGPDRPDIAPDEVEYIHNVKLSEAEPYEKAHRAHSNAQRQVRNYIENLVRDAQGLPRVGEGWLTEMCLFRIVEKLFPDDEVIHHYRAPWLRRLELDVYVVGADIGFEYQGIQHYEPQEHWGGIEAFNRGRERDRQKRQLCAAHGTRLIEVRYDEPVTEELVRGKVCGKPVQKKGPPKIPGENHQESKRYSVKITGKNENTR